MEMHLIFKPNLYVFGADNIITIQSYVHINIGFRPEAVFFCITLTPIPVSSSYKIDAITKLKNV